MRLAQLLDVIDHAAVTAEVRRRASAEVRALYRPMSTDEVAQELGITKPTVLKWMRAGLLREATASKDTGRLFDRDQVMGAKAVLLDTKLEGTVKQRAAALADCRERLGWSAAPEALRTFRVSLAQARAGETTPVSAEDLRHGRQLRTARLALASAPERKRVGPRS